MKQMLWRALLLEKDKVLGRMVFWVNLIILVAVIILIDVAQYFMGLALPHNAGNIMVGMVTWPTGLVNAAQFASAHALGGILLIVLVGVITSREYTWRTFHLWLSRGVPRITLLAAKCIMILLTTVIMVLTSLLLSGAITGILTLLHGTLNLNQVPFNQVILNFLITIYTLLPYVALTFMLTILSRSSAVAIGVGLVFVFPIESTVYTVLTMTGGTYAQIAQYLPVGLGATLSNATSGSMSSASPIHTPFPSPIVACLCLALYTAIFTGIAAWRFLHQNFTD
jgi:ABC-type transport system involved in multi-copper enzyme maturation permease subunit